MSFLNELGDAISSQFNLTSDTKFDQSSERRYLEEGYLRIDPYQTSAKKFEILWQEPSATVLIKKRMFSSISDNYRPDFMDTDEKLYYKAMCILFQNKCNQIAALERLSKIEKITSSIGNVSQQLVPIIISLTDSLNNGYANGSITDLFPGGTNPFTSQDMASFFKIIDRLRVLYSYNQTAQYTSWLTDPTALFQSSFGPGSGVIEITNFTGLSTTTTVAPNAAGQFTINITDPYETMLITDYDIELAFSDATNDFYNNKNTQFGIANPDES